MCEPASRSRFLGASSLFLQATVFFHTFPFSLLSLFLQSLAPLQKAFEGKNLKILNKQAIA